MVFEKLYKFVGKNIKNLVDRPDEPHCFRLQKNRVYYVKESLMKKATNVRGRPKGLGAWGLHAGMHGCQCSYAQLVNDVPWHPWSMHPRFILRADCERQARRIRNLHRQAHTHGEIQADGWGSRHPSTTCKAQGEIDNVGV